MTPSKTLGLSRTLLWLLAAASVLPLPSARGDGGMLRCSERCGELQVSVFTAPAPPRAGLIDVSVLVQENPSGKFEAGSAVTVSAYPVGAPERKVSEPATTEAATNKLFRAALLELPEPGLWQVEVEVGSAAGRAVARFQLSVEDAYPRWAAYGPWIGLPGVAVLFFAAHQWLVKTRAGNPRPYDPARGHGR